MKKTSKDLTPEEIAVLIRTEAAVQEINNRRVNRPFPMFRNVLRERARR